MDDTFDALPQRAGEAIEQLQRLSVADDVS
jgi:hypothetical protein